MSFTNRNIPDLAPNTPYVPSNIEATNYYHGFPSKPRLIARSSCDTWEEPTGPEAYPQLKELMPLGTHTLTSIWEHTVGPALACSLNVQGVKWFTMTPVRIVITGQSSAPAIVLVGIEPGSLTHELGIAVAVACRSILVAHSIFDVHVEIRESKASLTAALYKPDVTSYPAAGLIEPFSTSLGLPICSATTPHCEGTAGFFFTDCAKPGVLFMLTARHVLFHPEEEENTEYTFEDGTGAPQKKVMLLGQAAFAACITSIELAITTKQIVLAQLRKRAAVANQLENKAVARKEKEAIQKNKEEAEEAIATFAQLLADIRRDWGAPGDRVIGHVVLSPPICAGAGAEGYTEDWAVVQIHPGKIAKANFVGNAIDLGSVSVEVLAPWMHPNAANPISFDYPGDRLLSFRGTVSDEEMYRPPPGTTDQGGEPVLMVLKNGNTSGLTVGRLNTIRSFVRHHFADQPGAMSKEVAILPRTSKSRPFCEKGDSGSAVVDGMGRICGIITGGDGTGVVDITFVTPINFLLKRLEERGIMANIFPMAGDLAN